MCFILFSMSGSFITAPFSGFHIMGKSSFNPNSVLVIQGPKLNFKTDGVEFMA
jgi:hypothetical protein